MIIIFGVVGIVIYCFIKGHVFIGIFALLSFFSGIGQIVLFTVACLLFWVHEWIAGIMAILILLANLIFIAWDNGHKNIAKK